MARFPSLHRLPLTLLSLSLSLGLAPLPQPSLAQPTPPATLETPRPIPAPPETPPTQTQVQVGVMAIRGLDKAREQWQPTIDYLNAQIPGYQFELTPLEFEELEEVVNQQKIDFILPNPGMYVELEWVYGAQRIATLENLRLGRAYTEFGAVIFRRADRDEIQSLRDLRGKHFMAVDETAFGGWQMAWATILQAGVDPYRQFKSLEFGGTHDNVVYAVLEGKVDAGTVRTDTLERMEQEGKIDREDFVVLNQQTQHGSSFPFALSTELYPEWPFAAFPHTPRSLSEKVAIALMGIDSQDPAAKAGNYEGWTIPSNYQSVHETLRYLKVRPYENWGEVSPREVLYQYRYWLLSFSSLTLILGYMLWQLTTRQRIEFRLRQANADLEDRVKIRTVELIQAKDHAEAANRAKSEFLASMSHELRTPLNAILGFTQVLLRGLNQPTEDLPTAYLKQQRETLGIIHRSGEHLLSLINDVLDMSKIEAGRITLLQEAFDLKAMLEAMIEMLQLRAESKGLTLFYECDPDVPQGIVGDERKLRQILINLLGNGIKFTDEGSVSLRVTVTPADALPAPQPSPAHPNAGTDTTAAAGGNPGESGETQAIPSPEPAKTPTEILYLTFTIEDTGSGIAAADLPHLFEAFVQTESGLRSQEGTGLGLPISQQFVQLMGGDLQVESTPGVGSCFRFTIPVESKLVDKAISLSDAREICGLAPNQPHYRLLVVDDVPENRQLLVQLLQPLGFEVLEAANGQVAIEMWQRHQPDLIFMDIRMPVLSGYGATQQIRSLEAESHPSPKTMILALTASVFEDERAKILAVGCDDFLRKPVTEEQLFRKLTQHLGVAYVYRDRPSALSDSASSTTKLHASTEGITQQPRAWVAQLNLAARGADDDLIWKLLEQIPPEQADLAETLAELVNDFRLDKIISLTEAQHPEATSPRCPVPPSLMPTLHQVLGLAPDQPTYRILVVDDRSENRQLLVTILQPIGFVILEAGNGQEAIDRWFTDRPDLIFMDIRMPGLNGYQALAQIQQRIQQDPSLGPAPIVIALTASVAESEKTAIFEAGFDDLIRKPFGEPQLLDRLSHHLGVQYLYQDLDPLAPEPRQPIAARTPASRPSPG